MHTILSKAAGLDLILIDTQGLAQGQNLPQILKNLGLMTEDIAIHLTLPPFANPVQIHEFLNRYKTGLPTSLVWTKLDEAVSFGNIVNVSYEAELPISALSFGGELQESLCPATEPLVWRLVFKRQIPGH